VNAATEDSLHSLLPNPSMSGQLPKLLLCQRRCSCPLQRSRRLPIQYFSGSNPNANVQARSQNARMSKIKGRKLRRYSNCTLTNAESGLGHQDLHMPRSRIIRRILHSPASCAEWLPARISLVFVGVPLAKCEPKGIFGKLSDRRSVRNRSEILIPGMR
jgi:hypothetical protein